MNKKLKWVGLADSEYISRCGTFMVQLQDKDWHLFRRVNFDTTTSSSGLNLPRWGWSVSLFSHKRKGACQEVAQQLPLEVGSGDQPEPAREREPREGLTRYDADPDKGDSTCWCCGVRFLKKNNHKWGDLCGPNCVELLRELLSEVS